MQQLKIKEYDNGKLYISDESSSTTSITINDKSGKPTRMLVGEAINMSKFPKQLEKNYNNQMAFLQKCKEAGILPSVHIYELSRSISGNSDHRVLFITGSYQDEMKYFEMFYLPKAESIFDNLFHSQNWNMINAESSIGNVSQKGYSISSLDSFDALLRDIKKGNYQVTMVLQ
jgi:hypothetical protein